MRVSHGSPALSATFDDPNLVSVGGLAPVVALAQSCRLAELVADKLTVRPEGGVNGELKVPGLVAGMVAGADSIDDMDLLRVCCGQRARGRRRVRKYRWSHSLARAR